MSVELRFRLQRFVLKICGEFFRFLKKKKKFGFAFRFSSFFFTRKVSINRLTCSVRNNCRVKCPLTKAASFVSTILRASWKRNFLLESIWFSFFSKTCSVKRNSLDDAVGIEKVERASLILSKTWRFSSGSKPSLWSRTKFGRSFFLGICSSDEDSSMLKVFLRPRSIYFKVFRSTFDEFSSGKTT